MNDPLITETETSLKANDNNVTIVYHFGFRFEYTEISTTLTTITTIITRLTQSELHISLSSLTRSLTLCVSLSLVADCSFLWLLQLSVMGFVRPPLLHYSGM